MRIEPARRSMPAALALFAMAMTGCDDPVVSQHTKLGHQAYEDQAAG